MIVLKLLIGLVALALFFRAVVDLLYAGQRPVDDPDPYQMPPTWKSPQ